MLPLVFLFVVTFLYVGLKAMQQLNVVHERMVWVVCTSYGMAATEVYVTVQVVASGWQWATVAVLGTASACGCCISIFIHRRMRDAQPRKA
jgi:hypothetical protein